MSPRTHERRATHRTRSARVRAEDQIAREIRKRPELQNRLEKIGANSRIPALESAARRSQRRRTARRIAMAAAIAGAGLAAAGVISLFAHHAANIRSVGKKPR